MEDKRKCLRYIESQNADGDDIAGIIISSSENRILVGVTEQHGGDSEVSLDIEKVKELIDVLNLAIEDIEGYKEHKL